MHNSLKFKNLNIRNNNDKIKKFYKKGKGEFDSRNVMKITATVETRVVAYRSISFGLSDLQACSS